MARRDRIELLMQAVTAITLLSAVQTSYARGGLGVFVVLNAAAAAALALVVIRGATRAARHLDMGFGGANLIGVVGGAAAIIAGLQKLDSANFTPGHQHFALGAVTVATGCFTAFISLYAERMEHRRALTITAAGIRMRLNKFRRFDVQWSQITELRMSAKEARLCRTSGGSAVVPLGRLVNRDEVRDALIEAAEQHGVVVITA